MTTLINLLQTIAETILFFLSAGDLVGLSQNPQRAGTLLRRYGRLKFAAIQSVMRRALTQARAGTAGFTFAGSPERRRSR